MRIVYWLQYRNFDSRKDLPDYIMVEIISTCNNACWFCPNSAKTRPIAKMSREIFMKIVDELSSWDYSGVINLHLRCEPLLHRDFLFFVNYVSWKCPKASIFFATNGRLLTESICHEVLKNPNVGFVVNDYSCGEYELKRMRHWGLTDSEKKRTRFNCKTEPSNIYNFCGFLETKYELPLKQFCITPCTALAINAYGKGVLCFADWNDTYVLGDVRTMTLMEIWQGERIQSQRDLLSKEIRGNICSKCDHLGYQFKLRKVR